MSVFARNQDEGCLRVPALSTPSAIRLSRPQNRPAMPLARCLPHLPWPIARHVRQHGQNPRRDQGPLHQSRPATPRLERKRHQRPRPLGSRHGVLLGLSGSAERIGRGIVQHHRDHGGLQAGRALDWQIDRPRRFRLAPVVEPAKRPVGGERRADAGGQRIESDLGAPSFLDTCLHQFLLSYLKSTGDSMPLFVCLRFGL